MDKFDEEVSKEMLEKEELRIKEEEEEEKKVLLEFKDKKHKKFGPSSGKVGYKKPYSHLGTPGGMGHKSPWGITDASGKGDAGRSAFGLPKKDEKKPTLSPIIGASGKYKEKKGGK